MRFTTSDIIGLWLAALISSGSAACNRAGLNSCLKGIDASFKGDASYANATFYWNSRLTSPQPAAVLRPTDEQQIQKIVQCASGKTTVSVRSGGHSYEGYWQGKKGGVVVDLQKMNKVVLNPKEKKVTVGAGALLGTVIAKLWKGDKGVLPHGLQPTIGMGGMTLGGGFGLLSRNYGILVDRVTEMKMVDAKGRLLTVNAKENTDLFFALRGAGGGSFGVVTEFTYSYIKMDRNLTVARYSWSATKESFTPIVTSLMKYYDSNPPNGATHYLNLSPGGSIELGITYSDGQKDHQSHMEKLEKILSKDFKKDSKSLDFIDAFQFYAGLAGKPATSTLDDLENTAPESEQRYFKGRSGFLKKSLDQQTMDKLADLLVEPGSDIFVLIDLWGGFITQNKGTAFTHRDMFASVQMGSTSPKTICTLDAIYDTLRPSFGGAYQNYMDVKEDNFMESYYPGVGTQLMKTKSKHDPKNIFKFDRSIPTKN